MFNKRIVMMWPLTIVNIGNCYFYFVIVTVYIAESSGFKPQCVPLLLV